MNEEPREVLAKAEEVALPKAEQKMKNHRILLIINVICLAGIIALFILFFLPKKDAPVAQGNGEFTFAFVNTDSIMSQYAFVDDMETELSALEKRLQDQYAASVNAFQKEYNDYLKKGSAGLYTLAEQKKIEEKLAKKQESLTQLDQQLSQQLMAAKQLKTMEMHDTIVNYLKRYNESKGFTIIFEKMYGGGLLYVDPAHDITREVIEGLNKEYEQIVKNKNEEEESDNETEPQKQP